MKSFLKFSLAGLVLAAFAFTAQATPGGEGENTGCNGVGNANSPCAGGGGGNTGGAGGAGGRGTGVGIGIAAAQANAAAVAASNASANAAANQVQGQQQGQSQSSRNNNQSRATGGAASATTGAITNGATTGPVTVSVEGAKGDVYVAPAQERNPVATAYAAPVVASNGTCMGSSSGGGQGAAIGISFATTWTDSSCDIRYDAEALRAAGLKRAAQARLCQKADIAKAMEAAGTPCPGAEAKRAESILNGTQSAAAYQQVTTASIPALLP